MRLEAVTQEDFLRLATKYFPGWSLAGVQTLRGGSSAEVSALQLKHHSGRTKTVVVRCHGEADLAHNPRIALDEFKLLEYLHARAVPVAKPLLYEAVGIALRRPCLVSDFVYGDTNFAPLTCSQAMISLARQLHAIHRVECRTDALSFAPKREALAKTWADRIQQSAQFAKLRISVAQREYSPPEVLLHGDFWPGNVLWHRGRLAAVLDWEDFAVGEALSDVANARLEILWAHGEEAMATFTHAYQQQCALDRVRLAMWDLVIAEQKRTALPTWQLDHQIYKQMLNRLRNFVSNALHNFAAPAVGR